MARVPAEEVARIKREVSVQRLAEARGVKLQRHGADLVGLCPFHEDHEPSLVISPRRNLWHCLGACQAGGSVIDWVMQDRGVSFRHAVELLRADLPPATVMEASASSPALPAPVEADAEDEELLRQVVGYYHETLKESPEALAYLESRGLTHPEVIERFQLGFANRTLGYRLPRKGVVAGTEIRGRLQRLGILRGSGHEHFNGSLVIPVLDSEGRVVEIYGRKITARLRKGTPLHLYLPGPHRGVLNQAALAASPEVILCESLIDALTFWCAGFRNVTTAYGVNGFTEEMLAAFLGNGIERVLIAYDRDEAGEAAAVKLAERLMREGLECFRIELPHGMDVNEYALKVTPAARSLATVVRSARWLGRGRPPGRPTSSPIAGEPLVLREEPTAPPADQPAEEPVSPSVTTEARHSPSLAAASEPPTPVRAQEGAASEVPVPATPEPAPPEPAPPEPASPLPAAPAHDVPTEVKATGVYITLGERVYRVRGLAKNMAYDVLKINLMVTSSEHVHVDSFNLYSSRQRGIFASQAAQELAVKESVIKGDLRHVLLKLEELQEQQIRKALEPEDTTVHLNDTERAEALAFLQDPALLERISADFETCGLVGEHTNKLVGYLAAVSRKLERPLGVLVQSSSAAGKSALMEAVLAFMPSEERVQYSAMTGQSLFYMGETDLQNKILAIAEEEGAERASYALKLLQSEGRLSIASTGKDPSTGKLVTHEYHVEGPAAILLTTTAIDLDEELQNRCVVLAVDESREQTIAIHEAQRLSRTREGAIRRKRRPRIRKLHQNAQRLLRPIAVRSPYSPRLTFPNEAMRTRRDQEKYLTLIESIALLHQHQRQTLSDVVDGEREEYIEATLDDVAVANRLASEAIGRTLDELPPQTRRLLLLIHEMVQAECQRRRIEQKAYRFTRRAIREHTGWGNTQLKLHLHRLEEMEYLLVHRGGRGQSFVYELLYDGEGQDGSPFVLGLVNVEKLGQQLDVHGYDSNRSGSESNRSGSGEKRSGSSRPQVGGVSGGCRGGSSSPSKEDNHDSEEKPSKTAHLATPQEDQSYPHERRRTLVAVGGSAPPDDGQESG